MRVLAHQALARQVFSRNQSAAVAVMADLLLLLVLHWRALLVKLMVVRVETVAKVAMYLLLPMASI